MKGTWVDRRVILKWWALHLAKFTDSRFEVCNGLRNQSCCSDLIVKGGNLGSPGFRSAVMHSDLVCGMEVSQTMHLV